MANRCRLCTNNDREALVEELAARMWESQRDRAIDPDKFEDASPYWQMAFRGFASQTLSMLSDG